MNDVNVETGAQNVRSRSYLASLPERTARAGAALTGGLVYEAREVLLPLAVRRSKLYQAIVGRLLRITIEIGVFRELLTGASIAVRTTLQRPWKPSRPNCATKQTWAHLAMIWSGW